MTPFFKTFAWKLYWRTATALIVVTLIDLGVLILFLWNANLRSEQAHRWGLAEEIQLLLSELPPDKQDQLSYTRALRPLFAALPGMDVFLTTSGGEIKAALSPETEVLRWRIDPQPLEEFVNATAESRRTPLFGDSPVSFKRQEVFSAARFEVSGKPGFVYVLLPTPIRSQIFRIMAVREGIWAIAAMTCASLAGGFVLAYLIFNHLTKRFHRLSTGVSRFQAGDRSARVPVGESEDEVESLGRSFNEMAETIESHILELERKDAVRRELVENVSHDLRRPTTLIVGAAELAASELHRQNSNLVSRHLNVINENAEALKRLLNELYDLSALETAEMKSEPCPFPAAELLNDLIIRFAPAAEHKGLSLVCTPDPSQSFAMGDPNHIERVLSNLLDNAIRHTPAGGRIELSALPSGDSEIRFSVQDDGEGIQEEEVDRIFERRFQSRQSSESTGASGLGLAIVEKILAAHKSAIKVERLSPRGTRFAFILPLAYEAHSRS